MTKVLSIPLSLLAAVSAQAVSYISVTSPIDNQDNPVLMSTSSWSSITDPTTQVLLFKGTGSNNQPADWTNHNMYVSVDQSQTNFGTVLVSGTGGFHTNLHFVFNNTSITTAEIIGMDSAFDFNGGRYALNMYLEAAEGTTGTYNMNNTNGLTLNLSCTDGDAGDAAKYGERGKTFNVGQNVSLNIASKLTVSGRFNGDPAKMVSDSKFVLDGNLSVGAATTITDADFVVSSTGVFTANNTVAINALSNVDVAGTMDAKLGISLFGGTLTVNEGGKVNGNIVLRGGDLVLNGDIYAADGVSDNAFYARDGTSNITINKASGFHVSTVSAEGGVINAKTDVAANKLQTLSGMTGGLTVESGKTATFSTIDLSGVSTLGGAGTIASSTLVLNGSGTLDVTGGTTNISTSFTNNNSTTIEKGATLNVGTSDVEKTVLNNNATITVKGTLNIDTAREDWYNVTSTAGNLIIDGGLVEDKSKGSLAASMQLFDNKVIDIKNGGQLKLSSNLYLYFNSTKANAATLKVDASSFVDTANFQVSGGHKGRLELSSGSNIVKKSNIFVSGAGDGTTATVFDIALAGGSTYNFGNLLFIRTGEVNVELNGATLIFAGAKANNAGSTAIATLNLYDFVNGTVKIEGLTSESIFDGNKVKIGTSATLEQVLSLYAFDSEGKAILGDWSVDNNGFLAVAVPEPAEWAAIFGALALAFAAYRRRK